MHSAMQRWWPAKRMCVPARALLLSVGLMVLTGGAGVLLGPAEAWGEEPEIVAWVNEEPVTRSELERALTDPLMKREVERRYGTQDSNGTQLERLAMRKLITRRLILQEAARRDFRITQQDLSQATVSLRGRFKDLKSFGAWLQARGLDDRSLQDTLREDLLLSRVKAALVEGVGVTDDEVRRYYDARKPELTIPEGLRLRIITVKQKATAEEILAGLRNGDDFERLARDRAVRPRAVEGGDIGWVAQPRLRPALRDAVASVKAGETVGPVESGGEFLVVRVEERRPARTMDLAEVRPKVERRLLTAKQQQVLRTWLVEQEKKSRIEILLAAAGDRAPEARERGPEGKESLRGSGREGSDGASGGQRPQRLSQ